MSCSITSYAIEPADGVTRCATSEARTERDHTTTLSRWLADWRRERLAIDDLRRLSELHLADIGISRAEVAWVVHGKHA